MIDALEGLDGVHVIADDILVVGKGKNEEEALIDHDSNVEKLFQRLSEKNIKLNKDKIQFRQKEVQYMGHTLSNEGLKIDKSKIEAITRISPPNNVKELKMFMGVINYVSKFIPKISEETKCLRELEKKNVCWTWGPEQQAEFDAVKKLVTQAPVLKYFDPEKEITI